MDFIRTFSDKHNQYTDKIKKSSFIEGEQEIPSQNETFYTSLFEVFLQQNEIEYTILEQNQKSQFIMDMRMKLASDIHMDDIQQKLVSKQMIQNGLLGDNFLSTILYLNHHYKTNCVIKNKETDKYYKTGIRNYPTFITVYDNGKWYLETTKEDHIMYSPISDLQTFLKMDIQTNQIYKSTLKGIQTYKLSELETMATDNQIELKQGTKKKRKKDLYEELKLKLIQEDI
jgi:hypothetical protein